MTHQEHVEQTTDRIEIISGEEGAECGIMEPHTGKRTIRAIKMRLTRERCGGDRWARARIYAGESACGGDLWEDAITGEQTLV